MELEADVDCSVASRNGNSSSDDEEQCVVQKRFNDSQVTELTDKATLDYGDPFPVSTTHGSLNLNQEESVTIHIAETEATGELKENIIQVSVSGEFVSEDSQNIVPKVNSNVIQKNEVIEDYKETVVGDDASVTVIQYSNSSQEQTNFVDSDLPDFPERNLENIETGSICSESAFLSGDKAKDECNKSSGLDVRATVSEDIRFSKEGDYTDTNVLLDEELVKVNVSFTDRLESEDTSERIPRGSDNFVDVKESVVDAIQENQDDNSSNVLNKNEQNAQQFVGWGRNSTEGNELEDQAVANHIVVDGTLLDTANVSNQKTDTESQHSSVSADNTTSDKVADSNSIDSDTENPDERQFNTGSPKKENSVLYFNETNSNHIEDLSCTQDTNRDNLDHIVLKPELEDCSTDNSLEKPLTTSTDSTANVETHLFNGYHIQTEINLTLNTDIEDSETVKSFDKETGDSDSSKSSEEPSDGVEVSDSEEDQSSQQFNPLASSNVNAEHLNENEDADDYYADPGTPPAQVSNFVNVLTEQTLTDIFQDSQIRRVVKQRRSTDSEKELNCSETFNIQENKDNHTENVLHLDLSGEQFNKGHDHNELFRAEEKEAVFIESLNDKDSVSVKEQALLPEESNCGIRIVEELQNSDENSENLSIKSLDNKPQFSGTVPSNTEPSEHEHNERSLKEERKRYYNNPTIIKSIRHSAETSPQRSNYSYSEDFIPEDSPTPRSRKSSAQGLDAYAHSVTPLSYVSLDDRAISIRPRVPEYDSDQDTSHDEGEDLDFAQMNTAPPTTALNEADEKGRFSRPKSSHPKRRQRRIKESAVNRKTSMNSEQEVISSDEEEHNETENFSFKTDDSADEEPAYSDDDSSTKSYSDDLESMSLRSASGVSRNEAISTVNDANNVYSHPYSQRSSACSNEDISETPARQSPSNAECSWHESGRNALISPKEPDHDRPVKDLKDNLRINAKTSSMSSEDIRVGRITSATENLTHMQENLQDMFRQAKNVLTEFQSQLRTRPIQDLTEEVPEFTRTLTSLSDAYRACEAVTGGINEQLQDIRVITNEICDLLANNVKSEDLEAWTMSSQHEEDLQEEVEARAKLKAAKILEMKAVSSRATANALAAHELAVQAQTEASQAEAAAANARDEAIVALQKAESARKAALEKKRIEEEERKKKEERQRQIEEERRQKQEEEKKLAELAAAKAKNDVQQKTVEDRSDPTHWPRFIYSIDQCDFDTGVGVVIRAPEGQLQHEDVEVTVVDPLTGCLPLGDSEELISNIVRLTPADHKDNKHVFHATEPMVVALPHCAPRIHPGREPVIRMVTPDGKTVTMPTNEVQLEDIKDLRFVECRTKSLGTFAVFLRLKKEALTFNRKGGKVMSSADSRVTLACQSGTFTNNVNFTLEVQQIDPNVITSLKLKSPDECDKLLTTSPIITMSLPIKFSTPLTLTLPVPPNPSNRPRRPQTAGNSLTREKVDTVDVRLASARSMYTSKEEESVPDELHLLLKESDGLWTKVDDVHLIQLKKKDVVAFDMNRNFSKLAIIRTKPDVTPFQAEKMFAHLITALTYKQMTILVRQKSLHPMSVMVTCTQTIHLERAIRALADEGYDQGPRPSPDIMVTEGQKLNLRFRGNLTLVDDDVRTMFAFNTYIPFKLRFQVREHDRFAQRGFHSYRGFCQIYTTGKVKRFLDATDDKEMWSVNGQRGKDGYVDGDVLLCEQLIVLPKPEPETPKPLRVAPVALTSEGVVNQDLFKFLSVHLEYSDWKKLAHLLNVKHNRIQAILRQNVSKDTTQSIYDMLVTWSKRLPRSMDRTEILCKALACIRRQDLAEELLTREEEFRLTRAQQNRDSYLHKAFVTIVRNSQTVTQWRDLARSMGIGNFDVVSIESIHDTDQDRCMAVLNRWKERTGEDATIAVLANKLRQCKFRQLAKEVEKIFFQRLKQDFL
ncbi:putative autophagy-related protein 11 isoform X1 [Biomphalaria glabrata]|uniref:Autophagy-related protein 11 isoform X1 n=1 Tax=Biomphalaria glabrata TaxID=6526 RepID=A0A9W3APE6_BIOGL|nr:putative autophagy-related protein 11 isoform X1 [Biomphalaria glabrata]